jgi:small subunit ribosomal protein S9
MSKPLVQSTGRRKTAVARVRVRTGSGKIVINGRDIVPTSLAECTRCTCPNRCASPRPQRSMTSMPHATVGHERASRRVAVGYRTSAGCSRRGPRARHSRRTACSLRDPRKKESKKYGLKKARKAPHYSKR